MQNTIFIKNIIPPKKTIFKNEIDLLLGKLNQATGRKNKPSKSTQYKRYLAATILLEGLYRCHFSFSSDISLAVPHSPAAYKITDENKICIVGFKITISIVETMLSLGWIKRTIGYKNSQDYCVTTTLRPSGDLLKKFKDTGLIWQEVRALSNVIILRNYDKNTKNKYMQCLPKSDLIRKMTSNLNKINKFLIKQAICIYISNHSYQILGSEMSLGKKKNYYEYLSQSRNLRYLDFNKVQLRRVFSRNSMKLGGRFYGAWWQQIPKEYRTHITINHLPTIEIDYSGLHPYMMYHLDGLTPPSGDMYEIGLWSTKDEEMVKRPIVKEFFNAIVNDEFGSYKMPMQSKKIIGLTNKKLREKLLGKHHKIAHHFNTGYGLTLQYEDSKLAERVILILLNQGIVCLPMHDSFIVQAIYKKQLIDAMDQAYFDRFHVKISMKSRFIFDLGANGTREHSIEFPVPFDSNGEVDTLALHLMHEGSIHNRYVNSRSRSTSRHT